LEHFLGESRLAVPDFRQTPGRQSGARARRTAAHRLYRCAVLPRCGRQHQPVHEWSEEQSSAISRIETIPKNAAASGGIPDQVPKIRYWDKLRALELLCKYFNLVTERHETNVNVDIKGFSCGGMSATDNGRRTQRIRPKRW
jgi:hypothetical protein